MADRELTFKEMRRLFEGHGCVFLFNEKTQYLTITRGSGAEHRYWKVHAHRGQRDRFERQTVSAARRR
jgi:hypothetical protein